MKKFSFIKNTMMASAIALSTMMGSPLLAMTKDEAIPYIQEDLYLNPEEHPDILAAMQAWERSEWDEVSIMVRDYTNKLRVDPALKDEPDGTLRNAYSILRYGRPSDPTNKSAMSAYEDAYKYRPRLIEKSFVRVKKAIAGILYMPKGSRKYFFNEVTQEALAKGDPEAIEILEEKPHLNSSAPEAEYFKNRNAARNARRLAKLEEYRVRKAEIERAAVLKAEAEARKEEARKAEIERAAVLKAEAAEAEARKEAARKEAARKAEIERAAALKAAEEERILAVATARAEEKLGAAHAAELARVQEAWAAEKETILGAHATALQKAQESYTADMQLVEKDREALEKLFFGVKVELRREQEAHSAASKMAEETYAIKLTHARAGSAAAAKALGNIHAAELKSIQEAHAAELKEREECCEEAEADWEEEWGELVSQIRARDAAVAAANSEIERLKAELETWRVGAVLVSASEDAGALSASGHDTPVLRGLFGHSSDEEDSEY